MAPALSYPASQDLRPDRLSFLRRISMDLAKPQRMEAQPREDFNQLLPLTACANTHLHKGKLKMTYYIILQLELEFPQTVNSFGIFAIF